MHELVLCLLTGFALSLPLCAIEIPLLKRAGAGQNILCYVKEHRDKGGTPTMGGLGFTLAAAGASLLLFQGDGRLFPALAVGGGYLLVGLLDDLLKKRRKDNLGLRPYQKICFQLAVALIAAFYCLYAGATKVYLPFTKQMIDLSWGIVPLGVFVFLATVNCVNLTDGLDGLAGSVSAVFFLFLGALLALEGQSGGLEVLSFCLAGALAAYLVFNVGRASVFMGDTGSLALGGFAAALSLFSGNVLLLPFLGAMFVLSGISVILQIISYQTRKKRIFLMAPIHHHFQEKGFSEGKIAYCYAAVTAFFGLLLLLPYL